MKRARSWWLTEHRKGSIKTLGIAAVLVFPNPMVLQTSGYELVPSQQFLHVEQDQSLSPRSGLPVGKGLTGGTRSEAEMGPASVKSPRFGLPVAKDVLVGLEAKRIWGPPAIKSHPPKHPVASPTPPKSNKAIWKPSLVTSWHWMIDHELDLTDLGDMGLQDPNGNKLNVAPPSVYDIDWESNSAKTVKALHAMKKKVICYVDVGAYESYRADERKFPKSIRGKPDSHWEGSYWLDIRRLDVLLPIMRARFQVCKDKGFDAIEPDEVDGYANDSGFKLSYQDQLAYNRAIAALAHSMGLSVGLKGDIEQARDLWTHFDWTLNEQCFEFNECAALSTYFLANGKAVFNVEYDDPYSGHRVQTSDFCSRANAANLNSMKMPLELTGGRWPCR